MCDVSLGEHNVHTLATLHSQHNALRTRALLFTSTDENNKKAGSLIVGEGEGLGQEKEGGGGGGRGGGEGERRGENDWELHERSCSEGLVGEGRGGNSILENSRCICM